jgi:DNA helicase INO80
MKGNERKDRENRQKAEKESREKLKKEEDLREAKRAARKLNFLITQTELYSHFIGNKVKSALNYAALSQSPDLMLNTDDTLNSYP